MEAQKLQYKLPEFEGPLDMLLMLISKNKINIYDIQISLLCQQYLEQINLMKQLDLDVASEFLEMAAHLVYIKSALLLPKHEEAEELKRELTGRLLELQTCREAARTLGETACHDYFLSKPMEIEFDKTYKGRHNKNELCNAFILAAGRSKRRLPPPASIFTPIVSKKVVSVSSKIIYVLRRLYKGMNVGFRDLFSKAESKSEMIATFLALLELIKGKRVVMDENNENINMIKGGRKESGKSR